MIAAKTTIQTTYNMKIAIVCNTDKEFNQLIKRSGSTERQSEFIKVTPEQDISELEFDRFTIAEGVRVSTSFFKEMVKRVAATRDKTDNVAVLCNNDRQFKLTLSKHGFLIHPETKDKYRKVEYPEDLRGMEFTSYIKACGFVDYYHLEYLVKTRIRS